MGGGGGFLGLGGSKKPDTSAYEQQLAEQRAATEKAEREAAELKASQNAAEDRRKTGRGSLLATATQGDEITTAVKRKTLLGG